MSGWIDFLPLPLLTVSFSASAAMRVALFTVLAAVAVRGAIRFGGRSRQPPQQAALPVSGDARVRARAARSSSELIASRDFVRDIARFAEHIIMNDVSAEFWGFDDSVPSAAHDLKLKLRSRERAPFFAPDKVGQMTEKSQADAASCHVRW